MIGATLAAQGWRSVQTAAGAHAATLRLALGGRAPGPDAIFEGGDLQEAAPGDPLRRARRRQLDAARRRSRALRGAVPRPDGPAGPAREVRRLVQALAALGFDADGPVGLFFTEHEGETVAGALTIRHGSLVTLYLAASAPAPRKFSKMVPAWSPPSSGRRRWAATSIRRRADGRRHRREAPVIAQFKRDFSKTRLDLIGQHARWLF